MSNARGGSSRRSSRGRSRPLPIEIVTTTHRMAAREPRRTPRTHAAFVFLIAVVSFVCASGCRQDMHDQPKYIPLRESTFFADSRSARPVVEGTVARGQLREDELTYTGKVNGQEATVFPAPVTAQTMARGRERFNIYCSPCHGST